MNYVTFHDDLDGYMSAAIAKYSLPETASFYVTQYNKPFPIDLEKVSKDDELLIVDFSYSKEITLELREKFGKVITIDHHDSAFENLEGVKDCYLDKRFAGCVLTWKYFYKDDSIPGVIAIADDYDRYLHLTGYSYALQAWFKATETAKIMDKLIDFIDDRETLYKEIESYKIIADNNEGIAQSFSRSDKFKIVRYDNVYGLLKVALYNSTTLINEIAKAIYDKEELDIDLTISYFITPDAKVVFNLRSPKRREGLAIQVAKLYGGGGHPNAAGFVLPLAEGINFIGHLLAK